MPAAPARLWVSRAKADWDATVKATCSTDACLRAQGLSYNRSLLGTQAQCQRTPAEFTLPPSSRHQQTGPC